MNYKLKLSLSPLFLIELVLSALFIWFFGLGNFLIFILVSMLLGVVLLIIFWKNMFAFEFGTFKNMLTQFSFVIAGFLLIFPGILSSVFGILVLLFGLIFEFLLKTRFSHHKTQNKHGNEEIIDVEIIEDKK